MIRSKLMFRSSGCLGRHSWQTTSYCIFPHGMQGPGLLTTSHVLLELVEVGVLTAASSAAVDYFTPFLPPTVG